MDPQPSTDSAGGNEAFAHDVLRKLLAHIADENAKGRGPYVVSHAWTEGPMIRLVYAAPPSGRIWGLSRDTRESIVDPAPWQDVNEAVRYYYLIDFEENQPSASTSDAADLESIWWFGYSRDGLPEQLSAIPESHRYRPPDVSRPAKERKVPPAEEPRRYGNPSPR